MAEKQMCPLRSQKLSGSARYSSPINVAIAMPTSERRFPPPWSIEELNDARFVVIDSADQKPAYVYFEDERGPALGSVA